MICMTAPNTSVALSVLVQLARKAERDRAEPLLTEASNWWAPRSPRFVGSPTGSTPRC